MGEGWSYDMNMTTEQKQIAIAEFEGWKECKYVEGLKYVLGIPPKIWKGNCILGLHEAFAPPYLTSREAICGAVGKLDKARLAAFAAKLENVVFSSEKPKPFKEGDYFGYIELPPEDITAIILATPAQMADALLLTLGHQI